MPNGPMPNEPMPDGTENPPAGEAARPASEAPPPAGEAPPAQPRWESRLREASANLEADLRRMVRHLNDDVIPEVRRSGSSVLHSAADELRRLADRLEEANHGGPTPPPPAPRP